MGFYLEARSDNGGVFATKSFTVWNPNIEHIYVALGLENPYGEFSGNKEDATFTVEQLKSAIGYIENASFYSEPQIEKLHPFLLMMMGGNITTIDIDEEKKKTLKFLTVCLDEATKSNGVIINLG